MLSVVLIICFLSLIVFTSVSADTTNVLFNYHFNSDFQDSTASNNDLRPVNGTTAPFAFVTGQFFKLGNGSLNVSGENLKGLQGGNFSSFPDITITAWVNFTNNTLKPVYPIYVHETPFNGFFIEQYFRFEILQNGSLLLSQSNQVQGVDYGSIQRVPRNQWTFVSLVASYGEQPKFYINGNQVGTTNYSGPNENVNSSPTFTNVSPMFIGTDSQTQTFQGNIDEVSVWDKRLTTTDINRLYHAGDGSEFPFSNIQNLNFSVSYNSTNDFAVTDKITMVENSTDLNYKYAVSCDITRTTLWSEVFNNFYNFTLQNVSTSFSNPESYLTFNGIEWENVVGVTTNFDIVKNANAAYRDYLRLELQYQTDQNNYAEWIAYDASANPALYLTLNKTGSTLIVGQYFPAFSTNINIANFTLTGGNVNLAVILIPHHTSGPNTDEFTFTITESNNTGTQTQSSYQSIDAVDSIQDVELFVGNRINSTTFYKRISLFKTTNPFPEFVQFQNGERINLNGTIFETPAPQSSIDGDGFTVRPDFNNVFYSVCEYTTLGAKLQRHFTSPTATFDDWSNFVDFSVSAAQVATNTSDTSEGGNAGPGSGDFGTDLIPSFFASLGFTSTASKLLIWMLIAFVLAAIGFGVHPILGVLVFVAVIIVGVPIGMVPLWFLLVFIIIAGGIVAALYRMIFSGS